MEIAEICGELEQLARAPFLKESTVDACTQAASLLGKMREVILTGSSDKGIVEKLKWILVEQGEG